MAHSHRGEPLAAIAMSDFVNYHKRSVTLPAGCKDLMDLFDPPASAPTPLPMDAPPAPSISFTPPPSVFHFHTQPSPFETARHESGSVTLEEIEPLLARAYDSQMPVSSLTLHPSDDETVEWSMMRVRQPPIEAFHGLLNIACASPEQMDTAARVLTAHGVEPRPQKNFHLYKPESPPDIYYTIEPVPLDAAACAKLVQALFQALVPGGITAPLKFTYDELRRK